MNARIDNQMNYATPPINFFPERYIIKKNSFTIIFLLYLAITSIDFYYSNIITNLLPVILGLFALVLFINRITKEHIPILIFVGLLVSSFLASSLIVGRTGNLVYMPILFILSNAGIAMILIEEYVYSWGGHIAFYGLAVYSLIKMLAGVENTGLSAINRNVISVSILVACISLYILKRKNKKIDLKPAFIASVISIWGIGRSGIVSCLVLFFGLFLVRFRTKKVKVLFIICSLILVFKFQIGLFEYIINKPFFSNPINHYLINDKMNITGMSRWILWSQYFNDLNVFRIIFGADERETQRVELAVMDFNYHNSFIHLQLQTGFMGLITMAVILFALFKNYKTNRVYFFLMLCFIIRATTDFIIFFNRTDFILYFFIFYYLKSMSFRVPHIKSISAAARINSSQ